MAELIVDHVTRQYSTRGEPLVVLRGVSLELSLGQSVAIVGPSGSGKSTLLHLIGTLDRPTSGTIRLQGEDPLALDEAALADFRNRQIGFVFQDHHLLPQLSVLENVLLPTLARGRPGPAELRRAGELLDRVGLRDRLAHRPAELSGGERQRVAVARALIRQPCLVLADEPTGNLDRTSALSVARLLLELHQDHPTMLVVVTHSQEVAALMERQLELNNGTLG